MTRISHEDLYEVLGVQPEASAAQIRHAYYEKAQRLHPDRNPDPAAVNVFKSVTAAYAVLGDASTREQYDATRTTSDDLGTQFLAMATLASQWIGEVRHWSAVYSVLEAGGRESSPVPGWLFVGDAASAFVHDLSLEELQQAGQDAVVPILYQRVRRKALGQTEDPTLLLVTVELRVDQPVHLTLLGPADAIMAFDLTYQAWSSRANTSVGRPRQVPTRSRTDAADAGRRVLGMPITSGPTWILLAAIFILFVLLPLGVWLFG